MFSLMEFMHTIIVFVTEDASLKKNEEIISLHLMVCSECIRLLVKVMVEQVKELGSISFSSLLEKFKYTDNYVVCLS